MAVWCCWTSRRSAVIFLTKPTSGINGANTRTQRETGIEDSKDSFTSDTLKGGAKKLGLAKVLCENSGADV